MRHRKYSVAGRIRFEDALRVELHRQLRELKLENEQLRARLEAAEAEINRLREGH